MPMDEIYTTDLVITENNLKSALQSEAKLTPSLSSLEFIKNFARNFKKCSDIQGRASELVLN